ncbi:MAG: hypothetical protein LBS88_00965 [Tannerellaceae bacterium]|nr:hypothetical protein [Tannerellaceae bacterium]
MAECVFWYPRTAYEEIKIRKNILPVSGNIPLCDKPETEYWFDLENIQTHVLNEHGVNRENIRVTLYFFRIPANGGEKEKVTDRVLLLKQVQASRNGLVRYEYDPACVPEMADEFTASAFWSAVYHYSKNFYHEHEYHEGKADSILSPYMGGCDIRSRDNEAIKHYIGLYEAKFTERHNAFDNYYIHVKANIFNKNAFAPSIPKYNNGLENIYRTLSGAYIYYKAISNSIYVSIGISNEIYRSKLNIERQKEKTELIRLAIKNEIDSAGYSANYKLAVTSKKLGILSVVLGGISFILAIWAAWDMMITALFWLGRVFTAY